MEGFQGEQQPSTTTKSQPSTISSYQFISLPYFQRYVTLLSERQCRKQAQKCYRYFKLIKIKKGTILYTYNDPSQKGYILLNGCINLLTRKNPRQKLLTFQEETFHTQEERQNYLYEKFKFPKQKIENLFPIFFQEKTLFKYISFHQFWSKQQFGFGQLMKNIIRLQTAIAVQDSQLLTISKKDFDEYLKQFHYHKYMALISRMLEGYPKQIIQSMQPKLFITLLTSALYQYNNQDTVYSENESVSSLYFIIEGEIQIRKKVSLRIPAKSDTKQAIQKQATVKVCRMSKRQFIGQQQIFTQTQTRTYTIVSISNQTLLLKIDHTSFLKLVSNFPQYQNELIKNSNSKKINIDSCYQKLNKNMLELFYWQYQKYHNKEKQELVFQFVQSNQGNKKYPTFEVVSPQGIFFRDTYQKLSSFSSTQNSPIKNRSIKRHKQKSLPLQNSALQKKIQQQTSPPCVNNIQKQIIQKILFSPKKSINFAQIYLEQQSSKQLQLFPSKNPLTHRCTQKGKSMGNIRQPHPPKYETNFNSIKRDQKIYKRVLITNGQYKPNNKIDKSHSVKAVINHNFDEVIRQCITRKNQIKYNTKNQQNQLIKLNYYKTIQNIKNNQRKYRNQSQIVHQINTPLKNMEEIKKKIRRKSTNYLEQKQYHQYDLKYQIQSEKRAKNQYCKNIVNHKLNCSPKNKNKAKFYSSSKRYQSPEKIIYLNHMTKPITFYNSTRV